MFPRSSPEVPVPWAPARPMFFRLLRRSRTRLASFMAFTFSPSADPPALLVHKGPPNTGFAALHSAAAAGHIGCVRRLLQAVFFKAHVAQRRVIEEGQLEEAALGLVDPEKLTKLRGSIDYEWPNNRLFVFEGTLTVDGAPASSSARLTNEGSFRRQSFASFRSSGARTITQRCRPNFAENFRAAFTPACVSYASMACGGLPQVSGRLVGAAAAGTDGSR